MLVEPYTKEVEHDMQTLYGMLNERDRRRYAAIEAAKMGQGGQTYIHQLLGCDYKTMRRGLAELKTPPDLPRERIRKKGDVNAVLIACRICLRPLCRSSTCTPRAIRCRTAFTGPT